MNLTSSGIPGLSPSVASGPRGEGQRVITHSWTNEKQGKGSHFVFTVSDNVPSITWEVKASGSANNHAIEYLDLTIYIIG